MAQTIREFRHGMAVLKKAGLVSGFDARSVKPTPAYTKLLKRFSNVIEGRASVVNVAKQESKALKASGRVDVYKGKTVFPHAKGEKVKVNREGHVVTRQPSGVELITIPVKYHQLDSFFDSLSRNKKKINLMKRNDEYFAFRFYGSQSISVFRNIEALRETLRQYESVVKALDTKEPEALTDVYQNIEVVKVHRARDWSASASEQRQDRRKSHHAADEYKKQKRRLKQSPEQLRLAFQKENARKQKEYRDKLKSDPVRLAKYKKAAKRRAKKSRKVAKKARERKRK